MEGAEDGEGEEAVVELKVEFQPAELATPRPSQRAGVDVENAAATAAV